MERILLAIIALILSIPVGFLGGVVLSDFWEWFVLPVFSALPAITSLQGWGVMIVFGLFNSGNALNIALTRQKLTEEFPAAGDVVIPLSSMFAQCIMYLLSWAIGWFVYVAFIG